jgi:hypothetical protein|tara:strand:- start:233 stop:415 length:183 start_codon:yes stop_codon:yes gene_type:complete
MKHGMKEDGMKKDKKRMGMMYGSMPNTRKKATKGIYMDKKRNAMNAGGIVMSAMEIQKPN